MRTALAAHDAQLRDAIQAHDGGCSSTPVTGCVRCSLLRVRCRCRGGRAASARAAGADGYRDRRGRLRGEDYFGAVLNRAARVMAAGHGGQILLDGTTAGLLRRFRFIGLGARRLRDIAKPVEMFQVHSRGLSSEFPPLKTLDTTPGNLRRLPPASWVERAELADLETALKATPVGDADRCWRSGQDRLALEVADAAGQLTSRMECG